MRVRIASLLFLISAACVAIAQSPTGTPPDNGKLVIRPGGKGVEVDRSEEKAGFLIIRPGGSGVLTANRPTQTTQTTQTAPPVPGVPAIPPVPVAGGLPVPQPPGLPARKDGDGEKADFDYWFAVSVDGQRVGYVNWSAREMEQKGKPFVVGVRYLNLTVSRFGNAVTQWGEESTVETPAGEVLITSMRQGLGKDQALALTGVVEGKTLKVKGEGPAAGASDTPWPGGVVGLVREPKLFKELKLAKGESFSYPSYIPTINRVVKTTVTFEGEESKILWKGTAARKLLRFVTKPEPIAKVKLPVSVSWVDPETFEPLEMETDFPALGGRLNFLRTTKEAATAPVVKPVEMFNVQSIQLDREISGIHGRGSVVYKVTAPRDDEPGTLFASESRQQVKNLDAATASFELHLLASHGPVRNATAQPAPGKEFTESNFFVNWDNDAVKAHTAQALKELPATAGAWDKAVAIERWVQANMKAFEFSQAMATADNVAKTLTGDCTEYAMLSAAMCRAAGVPSRTALGLVYAGGQGGKPFLAYHMWFEVFAEGQWVPLDATLGMKGVGPGHIKIVDQSWHDEKTFAPLLPVLRTLSAKPTVTVLKISP